VPPPPPALDTPRLRLRPLVPGDLPDLVALHADADTLRHIGEGRPLTAREVERDLRATLRRYRRDGLGLLRVSRREDDAFLGVCGPQAREGSTDVELTFVLRPEARGKGLATEAAGAVLDHVLAARPVGRVVALAAPENAASIAVMERLGMTLRERTTDRGREVQLYARDRKDGGISPGPGSS
jgi:ribosomal-protein-alanine N-acetyltransferase